MTELRSAPSQLERTLGRLVEAGIARTDDLALLLGLDTQHIARPLRKLTLAGVLHRDPSDSLQLTPSGRAWLGVELRSKVAEPLLYPERAPGPRLLPLRSASVDIVRIPADSEAELDQRAEQGAGWKPPRITLAGVRIALARPRIALFRVQLAVPGLQIALARVQIALPRVHLSPSSCRRLAAVAASAAVVVIGVHVGPAAQGLTIDAPILGAPAAHDDPTASATSPAAAPVPTLARVASVPPDRWMVVQHTDGLGLVLRPTPASTTRIVTLKEGARVRVTGDTVQKAGRVWIPVASLTGKTGWVAGDFVAPAP